MEETPDNLKTFDPPNMDPEAMARLKDDILMSKQSMSFMNDSVKFNPPVNGYDIDKAIHDYYVRNTFIRIAYINVNSNVWINKTIGCY